MRHRWSSFILLLALAASANAQITRTATFDNFAPGQSFMPSFTDPLSGILFSNSTHPPAGGFAIDSDPNDLFTGSNYLTAGIGSPDGLGATFGFTATLPAPADDINMAVLFQDSSRMFLEGFTAAGTLITQSMAASGLAPSHLEISSDQFNISTFTVSVTGGFEAYDNITYAILPEPTPISCLLLATTFPLLHRRKIPTSETPSNQLES